MLKGCKQPDRNIASSNSYVALVMIFPGGVHRVFGVLARAQTKPGKALITGGYVQGAVPDAASHVIRNLP